MTDSKMTRFTITLNEGVEFVLKCLKDMWGGEIFIPKIHSYRLIDLVRAHSKTIKTKIIGIRPGEKIDEILISETESHDCYELKDGYALISKKAYYSSKLTGQLKKCKTIFEYSSRKNNNFLTKPKILKLLKNKF